MFFGKDKLEEVESEIKKEPLSGKSREDMLNEHFPHVLNQQWVQYSFFHICSFKNAPTYEKIGSIKTLKKSPLISSVHDPYSFTLGSCYTHRANRNKNTYPKEFFIA